MAEAGTYSAMQVARAATELRDAAGVAEESFSRTQVIQMLSDEIRFLRERGFTDERIAGLFTGFDIDVTPEDISESAHLNEEE